MALIFQETVTDSQVVVLDWISLKVEASIYLNDTQLTKVSFAPNDKNQLVTTGVNHWRFWKMQESTLKILNKLVFN